MIKSLLCLAVVTFSLGTAVFSEEASVALVKAQDFDKNGDGLDVNERRTYLMHLADPFLRKYDTNRDGDLSPAEILVHKKEVLKQVSLDERSFSEEHPNVSRIPAEEMALSFESPKKAKRTGLDRLWNIQIRRSIDDVDPQWENVEGKSYDDQLKKVKPAKFAYTHDFTAGEDIWEARGVVARPILVSGGENLVLIPSVSFDRLSNGIDSKKDINSLIFRFTGDIALPAIALSKEDYLTQLLRFKVAYKTQFDFDDDGVWAGEAEWEPIPPYFRTFRARIPGVAVFRPRAFLHAEYGSSDSDPSTLADEDKDFFRLGPSVALEIAPNFDSESMEPFNERILATLKYNYYASANGGEDTKSFSASLDWTLDSKGHFKMSAEYQHGSLELDDQEVETFLLGLGLAF